MPHDVHHNPRSRESRVAHAFATLAACVALVAALTAALSAGAVASTASAGARSASVGHGLAAKRHVHPVKHKYKPHRQAAKKHGERHHVTRVPILRGGRGGDPGDDYPAKWKDAAQDSMLDQWKMFNRECTSFAAWALSSRNGYDIPFFDNAVNWGPRARAIGVPVDTNPAVGSIAWSNSGAFGHVAWVSAVDGGNVTIEEYNRDYHGHYSTRTVPAASFTGYIHFKDIPAAAIEPPPPPPPPPAVTTTPAAPQTWAEQEGHYGVNTFTNPVNASGMGTKIASGQTVQVSCRIYAPQIQSVNPDGWWYRVASSPWNDAYYSPANTFMNGDPWDGPYTHPTDMAVRVC
jgi:surface antigen